MVRCVGHLEDQTVSGDGQMVEEDPSHLHWYHYEHNRPWHCDHYEQDGRQRHSDHYEEDPPQQQQNIGMPEESPWPSLPPWVTFVGGRPQRSRKV